MALQKTTAFVDGAVLLGLFIGSLCRAMLLRRVSGAQRFADIGTLFLCYSGMLYVMAREPSKPGGTSVWVLYPAFLLAAYVLTKGAERVLAMAYMLIPVFLVAVIAAVSNGLAK